MEALMIRDEELEMFGRHVRGVTGDKIDDADIDSLHRHYGGDQFQAVEDYESARRALAEDGHSPASYEIVMALLDGRPGDFD